MQNYFTKIVSLFDRLIPSLHRSHRYPVCFKTLRCRSELLSYLFLPFPVTVWDKVDPDIKKSDFYVTFYKRILDLRNNG